MTRVLHISLADVRRGKGTARAEEKGGHLCTDPARGLAGMSSASGRRADGESTWPGDPHSSLLITLTA